MIYSEYRERRLGGAACGSTACGLAGCDERSRRPQSAFHPAFDVASKKVKDDVLYQIQVVPNRWSGAFSGQGFGTTRQRAQRGVSLTVIHGAKRGG
ncbi:hypothetical protein [Pseudomonas paracarnis]|uniref:hypothetical protein n=1 Tax=Pseudomonas paracarnis TaxID=2750625 RepID=UPI001C6FADE4|nr:hypothetical protein [Pseudomonas paracarnis]MBW9247443.1 hypothetical protein [Pseudomonas paracarnis]